MDFTLPDGRVVRNIPQGTTPSQIFAGLKARGVDLSSLQNAQYNVGVGGLGEAAQQVGAKMSLPEKIGAGVAEAGQRAAGIPEWVMSHMKGPTDTGTPAGFDPAAMVSPEDVPQAAPAPAPAPAPSTGGYDPSEAAQRRMVAENVVQGAGAPAKAASFLTDVGLGAAAAPLAEERLASGIAQYAPSVGKVLPKALASIGTQAGLSAAQSPDDPYAALYGAGGAALAPAAQWVAKGPLAGLVSNQAKRLMEAGVEPTLGQSMARTAADLPEGSFMAGPRAALGRLISGAEEKSTILPVAGGQIQAAREGAMNQYSRGALGQVTGEMPAQGEMADMLAEVDKKVGDMYDKPLAGKTIGGGTNDIYQSAINAADNPDHLLTPQQKGKLYDLVQGKILDRFDQYGGQISGDLAKQIDSDLGHQISRYRVSQSIDDRNFSHALEDVQADWRTKMANQIGGTAADDLHSANQAYRRFITTQRAAGSSRALDPNAITPQNLEAAIVAMRPRTSTGARIIADDPRLSQYARAGQALVSKTPTSGTAERAAFGGALYGTVGGLPGVAGALGIGDDSDTAEGQRKAGFLQTYGVPLAALGYGYRPLGRALMGNTAWQRRVVQPAIFRQALAPLIAQSARRLKPDSEGQ